MEAEDRKRIVVCMGEALIDFLAEEIGVEMEDARNFVRAPGGGVANVAVGLARLGVGSRFVGKVGDDPFGHFLGKLMKNEGIDTRFLLTSHRFPTGLVFIVLDENRAPRFLLFGNPSADMMFFEHQIDPTMLEGAAYLHLGTVSMVREESRKATFKLLGMAQDQGVRIFFDPNLRHHLWKDQQLLKELAGQVAARAQIVKLSREELAFLTSETSVSAGAESIRKLGTEIVIVTLGSEGAWYSYAHGEGAVPGFKVNVVDTTGAGDGFAAGLLAALCVDQSWPPPANRLAQAIRFANAVGAMVTTAVGAMSSLPGQKDVEAFLLRC